MIKTRTIKTKICCENCNEDVNVHTCESCREGFEEEETIYCKHVDRQDNKHYHEDCKPEVEAKR